MPIDMMISRTVQRRFREERTHIKANPIQPICGHAQDGQGEHELQHPQGKHKTRYGDDVRHLERLLDGAIDSMRCVRRPYQLLTTEGYQTRGEQKRTPEPVRTQSHMYA